MVTPESMEDTTNRALNAEASFVQDVEIDLPITHATRIDGWALTDAYREAEKVAVAGGDTKGASVFGSIALLCSATPNFEEPGLSYTPMMTDGIKRSFIPEDLCPADLPFVAAVAETTGAAWLRARLIDYLFLKKERHDLWAKGIDAYVTAATECLAGNAREGVRCVARGLDLARKILGRGKPEEIRIKHEMADCVRAVIRSLDPRECAFLMRVIQTRELLELSELSALGTELGEHFSNQGIFGSARECWLIAGTALRRSRDPSAAAAILLKAAMTFETEADALLTKGSQHRELANRLFLRGIQAMRDARGAQDDIDRLIAKLSQSQKESVLEREELCPAWDAREISTGGIWDDFKALSERATEFVRGLSWSDSLIKLALSHAPGEPAEIKERAIESFNEAPLFALATRAREDGRGRTTFRDVRASIIRGVATEEQMQNVVCDEAKREWLICCDTYIEPCRRQIAEEHEVTLSDWAAFIQGNPIIPAEHAFTIIRGLHAGLVGDWIVSTHLLSVKVEAILRHVLAEKGVDTTTIESDLTQKEKMTKKLIELSEKHLTLPANLLFAIRVVLLEQAGFSIRHRIAHGFASDSECFDGGSLSLWWLVLHISIRGAELMQGMRA